MTPLPHNRASTDNRVRVWKAFDGELLKVSDHLPARSITALAFNASGRWLAYATHNGELHVWDCQASPFFSSSRTSPLDMVTTKASTPVPKYCLQVSTVPVLEIAFKTTPSKDYIAMALTNGDLLVLDMDYMPSPGIQTRPTGLRTMPFHS